MLVFHAHCQMGNQMFIYACARSLAKKRGLNYCLSEISHLNYFELATEDTQNHNKYLKFKVMNKIPGFRYKFEHFQDNRIDYSLQMQQEFKTRVWYYGYFQGESYFYNNHEDIEKCFTIKQEYQEQYNTFYNSHFKDKRLIIAHIRLKDYKTFGPDFLKGPDLTLPFQYYHENIKKILSEQPDEKYQLIFMSDDINSIREEFKDYNAFFSDQNMIIDFQLMQHAHAAVVSASSYAWWACWLNKVPHAKIIVPKYFLGFKVKKEFPVHMIPEKFIQSEVILPA